MSLKSGPPPEVSASQRRATLFLNLGLGGILGALALFAGLVHTYASRVGVESSGLRHLLTALLLIMAFAVLVMVLPHRGLKKVFLLPFFVFGLFEFLLQITSLLGILPYFNTVVWAPYARCYWTQEGFCNSVLNRYGWHTARFRLDPGSQRIALIGDSYVDAAQVPPDENLGVRLDQLLSAGGGDREVLSLGLSGMGPAQYLEIARYALRHFHPREILVGLYLGNDFRNLLPELERASPHHYIYYEVGPDDRPRLLPESHFAVKDFRLMLDKNHRGLLFNGFRILRGHCLTYAMIYRIKCSWLVWHEQRRQAATPTDAEAALRAIGLDGFVFRKHDATGSAERALTLAEALLAELHEECLSRDVTLRIFTIPAFPATYYAVGTPGYGRLEDEELDFLLPEKRLAVFAAQRGIPFLPLGETLHRSLSPEEIHRLSTNGLGHFTPEGHQKVADLLRDAFYPAAAAR